MSQSSSNEISLSIEETNALREKLGLKPLRIDIEKEEPKETVENEVSLSIDDTNELRKKLGLKPLRREGVNEILKPSEVIDGKALELKERIERSKQKRLLKRKIGTQTLGDGPATSTAEWLAKAQVKPTQHLQEKKLVKDDENMQKGYEQSEMSGIKLAHNLKQHLKEGEEVIMTLKDKDLIDSAGNLIEGRIDELENAYIAEGERYKRKLEAEKLIKRSNQSYTGLDEEEDGAGKRVLAKYDIDEKISEEKHAGIVDDGGKVKFEGDGNTKDKQSERFSLIDIAERTMQEIGNDDFMTKEESNAILKREMKRMRRRQKRKGKRKRQLRQSSALDEDLLKDEEEQSENILKGDSKRLRSVNERNVKDEEFDEPDDMGLEAALTKARQAVTKASDKMQYTMDNIVEAEEEGNVFKSEYLDSTNDQRVISRATEFSSTIEHSVENIKRSIEEKPSKTSENGTIMDMKMEMETEMEEDLVKSNESENKKENSVFVREKANEASQARATELLNREVAKFASGGIAAALTAFKTAGSVKKDSLKAKSPEKEARKAKRGFDFKDIDLTYRDKDGKILTTKEAYLELCYKFHGIKPGKKSLAKKKRKEEEEKRMQNMGVGDTPLGTASALRKIQAKTGAAFIKLDNKALNP